MRANVSKLGLLTLTIKDKSALYLAYPQPIFASQVEV